jgi:ribosomal protein S27AE
MPKKKTSSLLTCGNCDGGLVAEHDESGLRLDCPKCLVRIAGPFTEAGEIPDYKPAVSRKSRR